MLRYTDDMSYTLNEIKPNLRHVTTLFQEFN
jgi:hypothetical protein